MQARTSGGLAIAVLIAATVASAPSPGPPQAPPTGLEYELRQLRDLSLLPAYRSGTVAQESSYDRTGGNDDGFQGTYSSIRREGEHRVLAEFEGPGVVTRMWTPTPTDAPLSFYFDGEATPRLRLPFRELFTGATPPFVQPLVGSEVGGYVSYLPLPYAESLKIVYEGEDIRFHQIQVRRYPEGASVASFALPLSTGAAAELDRVVAAWSAVGTRPDWTGGVGLRGRELAIPPGESVREDLPAGRIVGLEIDRAAGLAEWPAGAALRITWDGESEPGITAPLADLFGHAFGAPAARGLLAGTSNRTDYLYLPMPYDESARVEVVNAPDSEGPIVGWMRIFHADAPRDPDTEGRLYTAWRREIEPPVGEPYLLLAATGRGHLVGVNLQAQGLEPGMTAFFEGDDVATIDGEMRVHGTGSEDFFNGGWYALLDRWNEGVSLPLYGALAYNLPLSRTGGYRFYMADKLSFERDFRLSIEHGPEGNASRVDYASVAFYYGERAPAGRTDLARALVPRRTPDRYEFYPQLMRVSLWFDTAVDYQHRPYLQMSSEGDGLLRVDVSEVPPGRYRVLLSYERGPEAAEFSVWRRQAPVSDWIDAHAATAEHVERRFMGEAVLTPQVRSLSIRTRPSPGGGSVFRFDRLVLEPLAGSE